MGTSVNQGSLKTPGWSAVGRCYTDERIPLEQVAVEVWRAATAQDGSIREQLSATIVEKCAQIVESRPTKEAALAQVRELSALRTNSVTAELAKRAALASSTGLRNDTPAAAIFRQVTDYLVARDIPGYVGESFRCKNIAELRTFKSHISEKVAAKVANLESDPRVQGMQWQEKVSFFCEGLKRR